MIVTTTFSGTSASYDSYFYYYYYFLRYIENLDKPYQSNWERMMTATVDNTVINDSQRVPVNWLPKHFQEPAREPKKDALHALWALRDLMMKDALCGGMWGHWAYRG